MIRPQPEMSFEKLEHRRLMTVSASLESGLLEVTGIADGVVEITASQDGVFTLTDNEQEIGSFTDVQNISVILDRIAGAENNDSVLIRLGNQSLDTVFGYLGEGRNFFRVDGDVPIDRLIFAGGEGADFFTAGVETRRVTMGLMRGGNDSVVVNEAANWLVVRAGADNDSISLRNRGIDKAVRGASIRLGHGDNSVTIGGQVENRFTVFGGNGGDRFDLEVAGRVGGRLALKMGGGNNLTNISGDVDGRVRIRGGYEYHDGLNDARDEIRINDSAEITGDVSIVLNQSEAEVKMSGEVRGGFYYHNNYFGFANQIFGSLGNLRVSPTPGQDIATRLNDSTVVIDGTIAGDATVLMGNSRDNTFVSTGETGGDLWVSSQNTDDVLANAGTVHGAVVLKAGLIQEDVVRPECEQGEFLVWLRGEHVCISA